MPGVLRICQSAPSSGIAGTSEIHDDNIQTDATSPSKIEMAAAPITKRHPLLFGEGSGEGGISDESSMDRVVYFNDMAAPT